MADDKKMNYKERQGLVYVKQMPKFLQLLSDNDSREAQKRDREREEREDPFDDPLQGAVIVNEDDIQEEDLVKLKKQRTNPTEHKEIIEKQTKELDKDGSQLKALIKQKKKALGEGSSLEGDEDPESSKQPEPELSQEERERREREAEKRRLIEEEKQREQEEMERKLQEEEQRTGKHIFRKKSHPSTSPPSLSSASSTSSSSSSSTSSNPNSKSSSNPPTVAETKKKAIIANNNNTKKLSFAFDEDS